AASGAWAAGVAAAASSNTPRGERSDRPQTSEGSAGHATPRTFTDQGAAASARDAADGGSAAADGASAGGPTDAEDTAPTTRRDARERWAAEERARGRSRNRDRQRTEEGRADAHEIGRASSRGREERTSVVRA